MRPEREPTGAGLTELQHGKSLITCAADQIHLVNCGHKSSVIKCLGLEVAFQLVTQKELLTAQTM